MGTSTDGDMQGGCHPESAGEGRLAAGAGEGQAGPKANPPSRRGRSYAAPGAFPARPNVVSTGSRDEVQPRRPPAPTPEPADGRLGPRLPTPRQASLERAGGEAAARGHPRARPRLLPLPRERARGRREEPAL